MDSNYISQVPMPACVVDTDGLVTEANALIKNVFVYEDISGSKFFALTGFKRAELINANEEELVIERNDRVFRIRTNEKPSLEDDIVVFFDEATARYKYRTKLEADRAVIVYINIDNYDEFMASASDDFKRLVPQQVDSMVHKWAGKFEAPVVSTGEDSYIMYTTSGKLDEMIEENFSILDDVRSIEAQIDFPASISLGIGISTVSLSETSELAEAALELALGRGGDQAVVKTDEGTHYYGGTMQTVEKGNRGKSRVIAHAMRTLIKDADKVLIMGHKFPDMDAFGSAIGACSICRFLEKEAYIVMDKHSEALDALYDQAESTGDYEIIKSEKALSLVTRKTVLIIVDTNRPSLIESDELAKACRHRIIIDHHRLTDDSYHNSSVAYIESYASSASELMAELMQHIAQKRFINKFEAEMLLAGIMVDSNNFSGRTGVRTFEAAAWLKRAGADTVEVKRFFQIRGEDLKTKAVAISNAEITENGVAYAVNEGHGGNSQIINAQIADELLMIKGVKATFVLGQNDRGQTIVSARSIGDINVQTIMEKMGGGGHFSSAACQVERSMEEVDTELRRLVREYLEKLEKTDLFDDDSKIDAINRRDTLI
ncbi:MAG: DHH family phosphoesterase [Mogibacterium sp.]|nr:DHH family phosphoesterase [Mogibacterium sp.]